MKQLSRFILQATHPLESKDVRRVGFRATLVTFVLLCAAGTSWSVVPERRMRAGAQPDSLFRLGLMHYDRGRFVDARWIFAQLTRTLGQSSPLQAPAQLMLARTLYRLGDLVAAEQAALPLTVLPPRGLLPDQIMEQRREYLPYARYLLAMIAWRRHDRRATVEHCYRVASDPRAPVELAEEARLLAQATIAQADSAEFRGMDPDVTAFVRDAIRLNRAIGLYHGGQWLAARMTAEALERSSPNTLFAREIASLISEVRRAERSEMRIAVIAPLGGPDSAAGVEIVKGVQFALERQRVPLIARPIIRDVRDQVQTVKAVQELAADGSVRAIIGPLTTQNAIAAAAVAACEEVPLVTPTASGEGIAGIGAYIFQVNTSPSAQGRLLASVAMDSLKARTVATLSSVNPDDRAMADAFAEEVRRKGGEVFIQEWFFPNTTDFRPQLARIRLAGLLRDTTLSEDIRRRLALNQPTELDTMRLMHEVSTIDVLLVSSNDPQDLIGIAAQIPTQKIWARVLGSSSWGNQTVRQQAGEDAEGVIFTTNFDVSAPATRRFVDIYRISRHENPTVVTALAYDAATLVARAIADGARTRAQVRERLAATRNWRGASGVITFDRDGSNANAYVRIIRGGVVTAVHDWSHLEHPSTWGVSVPAPQVEPREASTEETESP